MILRFQGDFTLRQGADTDRACLAAESYLQNMNSNSPYQGAVEDASDTRPILIVPYMWIGDFVRGHTVARVLNQRWPNRPGDLLATSLCAPLARAMTGGRA